MYMRSIQYVMGKVGMTISAGTYFPLFPYSFMEIAMTTVGVFRAGPIFAHDILLVFLVDSHLLNWKEKLTQEVNFNDEGNI